MRVESIGRNLLFVGLLIAALSCTQLQSESTFPAPDWQKPETVAEGNLTKDQYYDKILGLLVGSAIGDAMGAPTEMWHRSQIQSQVGYIDSLTILYRPDSPEGPWEDFMAAGSTTDDTRWKYLFTKFITKNGVVSDSLDAKKFASYLSDSYLLELKQLKNIDTFDPEPIERQVRQINWLQEWAKVAKPYAEGNLDEYSYARDRFYGGEMACGGMLYSPMIGGIYPANPTRAYLEAYRLGIFDLGYARDITALTAAMVARAMKPNVTYQEITAVCYEIDPLRYANSRLIGRMAYGTYQDIKNVVDEAKKVAEPSNKKLQNYKQTALYLAQTEKAYQLMDSRLQQIPFHAGEIHMINLAAIEFAEGDFQKAMEFVVNYGRDNDTVGAVTGAILGAMYGFRKLPKSLRNKVLLTSKNTVKIDLEALASELTEASYK